MAKREKMVEGSTQGSYVIPEAKNTAMRELAEDAGLYVEMNLVYGCRTSPDETFEEALEEAFNVYRKRVTPDRIQATLKDSAGKVYAVYDSEWEEEWTGDQ